MKQFPIISLKIVELNVLRILSDTMTAKAQGSAETHIFGGRLKKFLLKV